MQRKRSAEEEKIHILKKIKRLEKKIQKLPDYIEVDEEIEEGELEERQELEEGQICEKENLESLFENDSVHENQEETLEEDVLGILGVAPAPAPKRESLHREIAERWQDIIDKGLKKEEKEAISKENPPFSNIKMLAPKLNKEVSAALNESIKKRDHLIETRQKQISTALACLGQALQISITGNIQEQEQKLKIIKKMNEAGRLLCDSLYLDSKGRRSLILSTINKDLKDFLLEAETGEHLFGENLTERIKAAKAVQKSGKDLKPQTDHKKTFKRNDTEKNNQNRALNWRGPPRGGAQQRSQRPGGPTTPRPAVKRTETSRRGRK